MKLNKRTNNKRTKRTKNFRKRKIPGLHNEIVQTMRSMLPLKSVDTGSVIGVTGSGTVNTINLPATQGVANGQRTGDAIQIDHMELRSTIYYGDVNGNVVRLIVFQTAGNSLGFGVADILANGSSGVPDVNSFYVPFSERKRWKILYDAKHIMVPNASNATIALDLKFKPQLKSISFAPGSTFAETGQTNYLVISDSGILPNPAFDSVFRIWYRDI